MNREDDNASALAETRSGMNRYSFRIMTADVDFREHLHMHALFGMLQEAAARNAEELGWGPVAMDDMNASWIILRMSVRLEKKPVLSERIFIETWSRGYERLLFIRDFLIYDSKDSIIGRATSSWIPIDKSSGKPIRPQFFDQISERAYNERKALFDHAVRLKPFVSDMEYAKDHIEYIKKYADYSDIDKNLHVNNTRYIAWSMDAANFANLTQYDMLSADINYMCEIKHREKVYLFFASSDDEIRVDGIVEGTGKIAFCCRLHSEGSIGGSK